MSDHELSSTSPSADSSDIPRLTNALIGAYVGFFFGDWISGGQFRAVGMLVPAFVWEDDAHLARLVLPAFMHSGFIHLVVNALFLLAMAPAAERLYGRARVLAVYLLAGIGGCVASAALLPADATFGASAASLGVAGLMLGLLVLRGDTLPNPIESRMSAIVGIGAACLLLLGMFDPLLNNVAQVAGLVTGFMLSTAIEPRIEVRRSNVLAGICSVALLVGMTALYLTSRKTVVGTLPYAYARAEDSFIVGDVLRGSAILEQGLARETNGSAELQVKPFAENALAWSYVLRNHNIEQGIKLSSWSNSTVANEPALLDTLGYLYAHAGRCREARDTMGRAAAIDPGYSRRRDEVNRACEAGELPNPELPNDVPPPPVEATKDPLKA